MSDDVLTMAIRDEKSRQVPKRTVAFALRLDDETHGALRDVAQREDVPLNGIIVATLRRALGLLPPGDS